MIVVADTSPINYLVLVDSIDVLPSLYRRILIPTWVESELSHPATPTNVREWMRQKPAWLEVMTTSASGEHGDALEELDRGEREAILLAAALRADHVLIDETLGRAAAKKLGLHVIGTLGVLREAALRELIDLPETVKRLQGTSFRVAKPILEDVLRTAPKK